MRLFVISDLHLGGRPHSDSGTMGSQICHAYAELAAFIDWVRGQAAGPDSVELVINGDIVDFLMEDDYGPDAASSWSPDEHLVLDKLRIIINRTRVRSNYGPFEAMAALLKDGQRLTFLLGNHDVELSLPAVRRFLEELLCGDTRFRFIYDGEAYVRGDLLIEHGNRYDSWNVIDHSALREARSLLSRGFGKRIRQKTSGGFVPPPGSSMVINVINEIKRDYRFVDLLKPESEAVLPILLALHPNLQHVLEATIQAHAKSRNTYLSAAEPKLSGQLSTQDQTELPTLAGSLQKVLGADAKVMFPLQTTSGGELSAVESVTKLLELSANIRGFINNKFGLFSEQTAGARDELLRKALSVWRGKLSRDEASEVSPYREAVQELAREGMFNCVVFGHTHLPKREIIEVDGRVVTYVNTGTWTDTMQIPQNLLESSDGARSDFRSFLIDLKENKLEKYLERRLTYAEIRLENNRVVSADLHDFSTPK